MMPMGRNVVEAMLVRGYNLLREEPLERRGEWSFALPFSLEILTLGRSNFASIIPYRSISREMGS